MKQSTARVVLAALVVASLAAPVLAQDWHVYLIGTPFQRPASGDALLDTLAQVADTAPLVEVTVREYSRRVGLPNSFEVSGRRGTWHHDVAVTVDGTDVHLFFAGYDMSTGFISGFAYQSRDAAWLPGLVAKRPRRRADAGSPAVAAEDGGYEGPVAFKVVEDPALKGAQEPMTVEDPKTEPLVEVPSPEESPIVDDESEGDDAEEEDPSEEEAEVVAVAGEGPSLQ